MDVGTGAVIAAFLTATGVVVAAVINARAQIAVARSTSGEASALNAEANHDVSTRETRQPVETKKRSSRVSLQRAAFVLAIMPALCGIAIGASTFSQNRSATTMVVLPGSLVARAHSDSGRRAPSARL